MDGRAQPEKEVAFSQLKYNVDETYQITSSSKFPLSLRILPDVRVGFGHDGNEDVHHENPHDDLIDQPHDHS